MDYIDAPCHTCLKYAICNSRLKSEMKCQEYYSLPILIVTTIILKCDDYEIYIDNIINRFRRKDGNLKSNTIVDDVVISVAKEIFLI